MKGFKPTGFGPKAGFNFPTKMGFTGSTGRTTSVAPYTRRKAFADGGAVRENSGRMKVEDIGDQGSALVRRKKPYAQWQADVGATSSLLPGFKDGGANWIAGATKNKGALHNALGVAEDKKIPAKKLSKAARSDNPKMRKRAALAKTLGRMHKEDGGTVVRSGRPKVRGSSAKGVMASLKDLPALVNAGPRLVKDAAQGAFRRTQQDIADTKRRRIDSIVDDDSMASNYARGGKMKRMGYATGGGVSRDEAKKIAQTTIGEHVRYPAPKGHKGLGGMIAKRR